MTNLLPTLILPKDVRHLSDTDLEIASQSIRTEKDRRQKKFMSQFHAGMPIAITTQSGNTYPAYIYKTNKASIEYKYTVDNEYNKSYQQTRKATEKDLKSWISSGWINPAMTSSFEGKSIYDFSRYTN